MVVIQRNIVVMIVIFFIDAKVMEKNDSSKYWYTFCSEKYRNI